MVFASTAWHVHLGSLSHVRQKSRELSSSLPSQPSSPPGVILQWLDDGPLARSRGDIKRQREPGLPTVSQDEGGELADPPGTLGQARPPAGQDLVLLQLPAHPPVPAPGGAGGGAAAVSLDLRQPIDVRHTRDLADLGVGVARHPLAASVRPEILNKAGYIRTLP